MELSVIIVSWKVKEKLRTNLNALFNSQGDFKFEVFVIDNNSEDGSAEMIKKEFPQVVLIANDNNRGFAAANNQAIKKATGNFILLLNPDMQVAPDTLEKSLGWAEHNPQATVIGCKLISEDGKIIKQVRRFPKILDQLAVTLKLPHIFPAVINKYLCSDFNYEQAAKVDSIRGAFFLINCVNYEKISGQKLPLLDERYFVWFEEVDFCREVHELGGEVWYTPVANCIDYVGQSFKQVKLSRKQQYVGDSLVKYFAKWEPKWQSRVFGIMWRLIRLIL
jgi:hypothetical protein